MSRSLDFFFFLLVLDPDGSGMSDGRGQSSPCLGLGPAPKSPPATFGRLGLTACGSNAGAMDGDPRRLPVSGHEITRRSFGSRRARLPRSHQGRLGWSEMGKVDGKDKRKPRRAGQGWWVREMQGPSAFLEDFLPLSPFSLLLFCPLFPCPVGCPLRSVDVVQFKRPTPSLDPAALGRCNCNRTNAINLFRPRPRHPQTASSPFAMHLRQLLSREHARRRRPLQPSCSDDAASSPWHPSWSQPASQHPPPPSQPLTM